MIVDSPTGIQILRLFMTIDVVFSDINPNITSGKFAQSDNGLYVGFSKATTGGPSEIYSSSNGEDWSHFRSVIGNGDSDGDLAYLSDFLFLGDKLLLASSQRGHDGPTKAQLWLLELGGEETENGSGGDQGGNNSTKNTVNTPQQVYSMITSNIDNTIDEEDEYEDEDENTSDPILDKVPPIVESEDSEKGGSNQEKGNTNYLYIVLGSILTVSGLYLYARKLVPRLKR